jgi:uncharacterized membrane protein
MFFRTFGAHLMTDSAENYTPVEIRTRLLNQALRVWLVTIAVIAVWLGAIVAAPFLQSSPVYHFFSYICHQIPDRSIHLAGHPMAVCSRCFGVYFGLFAGILVYPLIRPIDEIEPLRRLWLFVSLIPITVDWSLTVLGIWENTHVTRVITGVILGVGCAVYIVPALVEVVRNTTARRLRTQ